jgi:hypothetical protein
MIGMGAAVVGIAKLVSDQVSTIMPFCFDPSSILNKIK